MNNRILTKIVTLCLCMSVLVSAEKSKDQLIKGNKALADTREQMINDNSQEKMKLEGITNDLKVVDVKAKKAADRKPFVIGGGQIYKLALKSDLIDRIYLTRIHQHYDGDTYFPELGQEWKLVNLG